MNTKIIGILIIILGLGGILGGVYFVYKQMYYKSDLTAPIVEVEKSVDLDVVENKKSYNLPIKTENGSVKKIIELQKKTVIISGKEKNVVSTNALKDEQLKRTASLFVERFGSYSNQSNFSNISDLKIYMSDKMKVWADDFIKKNNIDRDISVYYGITTKSISQKVDFVDEDAENVSILVNTLRRESGENLDDNNSFYQEVLITFVSENDSWKVDSANWK